mgnify:FL=1
MYAGGIMMKSAAPMAAAEAQVIGYRTNDAATATGNVEMVADDEVEESGMAVFSLADGAPAEKGMSEQQVVQIRENFNETAFFYPSLLTNEEGVCHNRHGVCI